MSFPNNKTFTAAELIMLLVKPFSGRVSFQNLSCISPPNGRMKLHPINTVRKTETQFQSASATASTSALRFLCACMWWATWLLERLFIWKPRFPESPQGDPLTSPGPEQIPSQTLKVQRLMERRGKEVERALYNCNVIVTFGGSTQVKFSGRSGKRKRKEHSEDDEEDSEPICTPPALPLDDELPPSPSTRKMPTTVSCPFLFPGREDEPAASIIFHSSHVTCCWPAQERTRSWLTSIDIDEPSSEDLHSPFRTCPPVIDDCDCMEVELALLSDTDIDFGT
ncbi:hypothetical protein B0H11DRAFT_1923207 [Mycena galericulata]|nr:hypothetical protein B0H11DRAFT_1923207 [Mycena galericulata]